MKAKEYVIYYLYNTIYGTESRRFKAKRFCEIRKFGNKLLKNKNCIDFGLYGVDCTGFNRLLYEYKDKELYNTLGYMVDKIYK